MMRQEAIIVRNAKKTYGQETRPLNNLNMTVSKGSV